MHRAGPGEGVVAQWSPQVASALGDGAAVDVQDAQCHGTVGVDGERWDATLRRQAPQCHQHHLGAIDGECGNDHHAAPFRGPGDGIGEDVERDVLVLVEPVPVGRLAHDHVGGHGVVRGSEQRVGSPTEVTGEQQGAVRAGEVHGHRCRAEDVSGVPERDVHARDQLVVMAELVGPEEREGQVGVGAGVEREGGMVLGVPLAVGVARLLLLQTGGVLEDDLGEFGRRRRAENGSGEALARQRRQVPHVVEVGVGDHDGVDAGRIERERSRPDDLSRSRRTAPRHGTYGPSDTTASGASLWPWSGGT